MLIFDILFGILSIYYCWLDLFMIYYGGNTYCNIPLNDNQTEYEYAQSSLLFILLSFIAINFIFIWFEAFRFVEVIVFQHNKRKLKQIRNIKKPKQNKNRKKKLSIQKQQDYESVNLEDLSKSINDNQLDIILPNDEDDNNNNNNNNNINKQNKQNINQGVVNDFDVNQWIEGLFVYGVDNNNNNNNNDNDNKDNKDEKKDENNNDNNLDVPTSHKPGASLSQFWKATTGVVTTGFILSLTSDDFCCVCWDEFEIGNSIAKLVCGHIIHKNVQLNGLNNL